MKKWLQKQKSNKITHIIEEQIEYVSNENTEESVNQNIIENEIKEVSDNEIIGTLTIPDILLENAPIMEGTESSTLQQAIGHFESTSLFYGNVGHSSHNSGGQGDYFKNLKDISIGSFIYYKTENGIKKYIEVKSTSGTKEAFNMSSGEIKFMKKGDLKWRSKI